MDQHPPKFETSKADSTSPLTAEKRDINVIKKPYQRIPKQLWHYRPRLRHIMLFMLSLVLLSVLLVLPLRWFAPMTTAFMLSAQQDGFEVGYEWVDMEHIPPMLMMSVIAAEDQKFPHHAGFDLDSIQKALTEKRQRRRGASTLSQQLAKNLFLWSGRSYTRKGLEAYFTVLLELFLPKPRLLELYLNTAEFGPGLFGVGASSQSLLNKQAKFMSAYECSLFAAVLPNPKRLSIKQPSSYVKKRAAAIRKSIGQLGGTSYLKGINISF